jgi:hypothetical protein
MAGPVEGGVVDQWLYHDEHSQSCFGQRLATPALLRIKMIQVDRKLRAWFGGIGVPTNGKSGKSRVQVPQGWTEYKEWWSKMAGFDYKSVREWEEVLDSNDGWMPEWDAPGPKLKRLESDPRLDEDELKDWVQEKVDESMDKKKGTGRLTLSMLHEDFEQEKQIRAAPKQFRRALKRLGFEYSPVLELHVSKRNAPNVQARLKGYCRWIWENAVQQPPKHGGTEPELVWTLKENCRVAWTDASWVTTGMVNKKQWHGASRVRDGRGRGMRIALLDAIFAHRCGEASCRTSWSTRTRYKAGRTFFGNVTGKLTREHCAKIFDCFHGDFGTLVCDNASVYTETKEKVSKMTVEELTEFVEEEAGIYVGEKDRRWLTDYIVEQNLRHRLLEDLAEERGCAVRFLPQYYPECNPIERLWRELKRAFRSTDPNLPWQERLDLAYASITPRYVERIISSTIKWCVEKHAEFEAAAMGPALPPAPAAVVLDPDVIDPDMDDGDSDVDGELLDPVELLEEA